MRSEEILVPAIAVDASGLVYVTGQTVSDASIAPFPTTSGAYQSTLASTNGNAFLAVLNTTQSAAGSLSYSTYLGGDGNGGFWGLRDGGWPSTPRGDAFLTGQTSSDASGPFPTTSGAYQTTLNSANGNVFLTELSTAQVGSASLAYSTYLGGSTSSPNGDSGSAIALDTAGRLYLTGDASSSDFPITSGAFSNEQQCRRKGGLCRRSILRKLERMV